MAAGRTHTGTARSTNQDAMLIGTQAVALAADASATLTATLERPLLLAVADGMGGHAAGERASAAVVERLAAEPPTSQSALAATLADLHRELLTLGKQPDTWGLGSTFCCALLGEPAVGATIGDGFIAQSSGRVVRPLAMTWDEIAANTTIDAAIGGGENSPDSLSPRWFAAVAESGTRYVLASDGLIRALEYDAFRSIIKTASSVNEALDRIFAAALSDGSPDNITCIIADIGNRSLAAIADSSASSVPARHSSLLPSIRTVYERPSQR